MQVSHTCYIWILVSFQLGFHRVYVCVCVCVFCFFVFFVVGIFEDIFFIFSFFTKKCVIFFLHFFGYCWVDNLCSVKSVFRSFAKFTKKHPCQSLFINKLESPSLSLQRYMKKETQARVFFCEFCEISKNILRKSSGGCFWFFKVGVLKNFLIFTGKYLCWSPFLI